MNKQINLFYSMPTKSIIKSMCYEKKKNRQAIFDLLNVIKKE